MTNDNDAPDYPATVARLEADGWSPTRIMSGLGHPNHGARDARRFIKKIKAGTHTPHEAVYGKRGWRRQQELLG